MTLSTNTAALATPDSLLLDRVALSKACLLIPFSVFQIVNGLNQLVIMSEATQNVAKHFPVFIRDAGTGRGMLLSGAVLSLATVQIKKGGSTTYTAISPVLTPVGSTGLVDMALTASHLDTLGVASINISIPGALPVDDYQIDVVAFDKNDSVRGGLTAIPNATAAAVGGLPTVGATIPNATAGTSTGLPLKQDVDAVTTNVNAHTDTATAGVTTNVNAHTDTATAGVTTNVNAHTDTATAGVITAIPTAAQVRDAVLNALLQDHSTPGSLADGIAIASGLLQGNFMMDNVTNDANGQTAARIRLWRDAAGVSAATSGGSGEGEFATFDVATSYTAPGKVLAHRVTRVVGT